MPNQPFYRVDHDRHIVPLFEQLNTKRPSQRTTKVRKMGGSRWVVRVGWFVCVVRNEPIQLSDDSTPHHDRVELLTCGYLPSFSTFLVGLNEASEYDLHFTTHAAVH